MKTERSFPSTELVIAALLSLALSLSPKVLSAAETGPPTSLSLYGRAGVIDTPVANDYSASTIGLTYGTFDQEHRLTGFFQVSDRLSGSFRYIANYSVARGAPDDHFDRSIDFAYRIVDETQYLPAVKIGLRDTSGTSLLSSEYIVASKSIGNSLRVSAGLGFGRLARENRVQNPLRFIDDRFENRPGLTSRDVQEQFNGVQFFRGEAGLFGSIEYQITDQLIGKIENSTDDYRSPSVTTSRRSQPTSDINFGLTYMFENGGQVSLYHFQGERTALSFGYQFSIEEGGAPIAVEAAPPPLIVRANTPVAPQDESPWFGQPSNIETLENQLRIQKVNLLSVAHAPGSVEVRVSSSTYDAAPQTIGRTARILARQLPASVERFSIVYTLRGLPVTEVTIMRRDLEALEFEFDATGQLLGRAKLSGADPGLPDDAILFQEYPSANIALKPFIATAFFDPDNPIRADVGLQLNTRYSVSPGLSLLGIVRQDVVGNRAESTRFSNSVLPRVRSDAVLYDKATTNEISVLTAQYLSKVAPTVYARASAGYFERMFAGLSGEVLWVPNGSRLALGADINRVRQREVGGRFAFRDYEVTTGHVSVYAQLDQGYAAQLDVGQYLAGDRGATFTLERVYANGWRVGGYFTLTDVPFDTFGEGSFDKAFLVTVPLSWALGEPSQTRARTKIQPILRDGGARLGVPSRLYAVVRDGTEPYLNQRWGRFWR
ncbi:MAG: YjbH domain-containing protein [Pseudomonadota bacterium]